MILSPDAINIVRAYRLFLRRRRPAVCNTVVWQRKSYIRVFAITVQAIIMIKKTMLLLVAAVMVVAVLTAGCTFNIGTTSPSPSRQHRLLSLITAQKGSL